MEEISKSYRVKKVRVLSLLGIAKSSYYYWKKEVRSQRAIENEEISRIIESIWLKSNKTYGALRICKTIRNMGFVINIKRVRRLMKENKIYSIVKKKIRYRSTKIEDTGECPNRLQRNFKANQINEKWVSDITYIHTQKDGWFYLSSIMDLYSRKMIAHKVGKFMDVGLVMENLKMAMFKRGSYKGTIIHTDRGSQYLSKEYREFCSRHMLELSYSRKGNPQDNACIESFHATLKKEYVYMRTFLSLGELRKKIYEYIELWYNEERMHSSLGYMSPNAYEAISKNKIA